MTFALQDNYAKTFGLKSVYNKMDPDTVDLSRVVSGVHSGQFDANRVKTITKRIRKVFDFAKATLEKRQFVVHLDDASRSDWTNPTTYRDVHKNPDKVNYINMFIISLEYASAMYMLRHNFNVYRDLATSAIIARLENMLHIAKNACDDEETRFHFHQEAIMRCLVNAGLRTQEILMAHTMGMLDGQLVADSKAIYEALSSNDAVKFAAILDSV